MKEDLVRQLMDRAGTDVSGKWMSRDHARVFAELLVRECVAVILAAKPGVVQVPAEVALDQTAKNVKTYFGVEL